jgi:hypothetical protein
MQRISTLKYTKINNQRYMQYRQKSFKPILDVVYEINFESIVDELLLERDKIHHVQLEDINNKLTIYERAILCEINYWTGNG